MSGRTALLAADVQRDFLPGGALGVDGGDAVIDPLLELASRVSLVVASRDFHPSNHCSFVARGGPWPPHCVIGTDGAALHPRIDAVAQLVVSKGMHPDREQYSCFDSTGLAEMLGAAGVALLLVGGIATDYCVRASAIAAAQSGFATTVVTDAVRAVDVNPGDGERALQEMATAGVQLATLAEVQRALGAPA